MKYEHKDTMDQPLEEGDWIVYTTGGDTWEWTMGVIVGSTPKCVKYSPKYNIKRNKPFEQWNGEEYIKPVPPHNCLKMNTMEKLKMQICKMELKK